MIVKIEHEFTLARRSVFLYLCFIAFLLVILMGCNPSEQDKRDKYQETVNPENGKFVEVNGERFQIIYIGGTPFRFPNTRQFRVVGGRHASRKAME